MGRSSPWSVVLIGVALVLMIGTFNTLQESGAPVDLKITLTLEYQGNEAGSIDLAYHWVSGELDQSYSVETIKWTGPTATASASTNNEVEQAILDYLGEASAAGSWIQIERDGSWVTSFHMMIGGCLPINVDLTGSASTVHSVTASGERSLLPQGLKTTLAGYGITNLNLKLAWEINISQGFMTDWIKNVFEVVYEGWTAIVETGSQIIGAVDI